MRRALNSLKHHGFYYGALLYAFLIPFPPKIINIAIIIWVLLSIIGSSSKTLVKNNLLWLLPAFYLSYFTGFFTSEFFSFKFLEYKLSFLIFPLLFFLNDYDERQRNTILKMVVWGLVVAGVACLIGAIYHSIGIQSGVLQFRPNVLEGRGVIESILYGGNYFFGRHFSIFHQTVYFALYLTVGIAILLFRPKLFTRKLRLVFLAFLVGLIFLISNRASFVALIVVFGLKLLMWNARPIKKWIGVSLLVAVFISFAFLNPRIKESIIDIADGKMELNKEARYGFGTRLLSWDAALSLIKEKPIFGYGHSETQNMLNKRYKEKGYIFPLKESYNAHNLWLQSWLENGLIAVLLILAIFWVLFSKSYGLPLILSFVLILFVNSMFEGMFNRFSGISFVAFMVGFIFSTRKKGGVQKV